MLLIGTKPIEHIYIDTSRVKYIFIGKNQVYSAELQVTYKQNDDGTLTITGLADEYKNIDVLYIPSQIDNKTVTSIGQGAFHDCDSLTSVTIPDSVTSIGNYVFAYCDNLTNITIPDSVTSIGAFVFQLCTGLTSVVIGESVTSIGDSAFEYCTSLTSIKYRGTKEEWNTITKGENWDQYTGNYTIQYLSN